MCLWFKPLRLFRPIGQNAFAFVAERKIHRSGDLLADGGMSFNLLADRLYSSVGPEESVGQCLVFAQEAQEQVFGFDIGTTELASLVSREEDHPARFLRVSLKHRICDAP